jgi:hypothetical protein
MYFVKLALSIKIPAVKTCYCRTQNWALSLGLKGYWQDHSVWYVLLSGEDIYLIQRKDTLAVFPNIVGTSHLCEVLLYNGKHGRKQCDLLKIAFSDETFDV